jgi:hypothetical protein
MSPTSRGQKFASLFGDPTAKVKLARLGTHTRLPTFNLATTSLRHIPKWFDRLDDIIRGIVRTHGNFISDPKSAGLINDTTNPPTLTPTGSQFFSHKATLYTHPAKAEYELVKALYFSGNTHTRRTQQFIDSKRTNLLSILNQFRSPRDVFLTQPRLLVIAELVSDFPGALGLLQNLSDAELIDYVELSEGEFENLCSGSTYPVGLSRLCRRISGEFTRASERRIHYLMSMALLTIAATIPIGATIQLRVPPPFSNLITEQDIFNLYTQYTSDITVQFDGTNYFVSKSTPSVISPPIPSISLPKGALIIQKVNLRPQKNTPAGKGSASATHQSRNRRRAAQQASTTVIINLESSERAEDYAEVNILRPQYGARLIRAGHRDGETIALPDGMVPGADFYVIDTTDTPEEFIEIKGIDGTPPANIQLTRAEYLRACKCFENGLPYRLILVNQITGQCYEVSDFAAELASLSLNEVLQFSVNVG